MRLDWPIATSIRALHIGGYWRGPNDIVRQMMLGLRQAGAEVIEYDTDAHQEAVDTEGRPYFSRGTKGPAWLLTRHLQPAIDAGDPHLIICNAGGLAFRPAEAALIRSRHCLLGIALSDPNVFWPTTRHIAPTFDRFLTNAPSCIPRYEELGVDVGLLPIATNAEYFRPGKVRDHLTCDALVIGTAHPDRIEPVRALQARFRVHVYGEGWARHGIRSRGLLFGEDLLAALASASTTIVFFRTSGGHPLVKVGLFDFAAAGALVVTNHFSEVARYFRYGEEILGFSSTEELLAVVERCRTRPDDAQRIRAAGRNRAITEHTWPMVWSRLLEDLAGPPRDHVRQSRLARVLANIRRRLHRGLP